MMQQVFLVENLSLKSYNKMIVIVLVHVYCINGMYAWTLTVQVVEGHDKETIQENCSGR